MTGKKIELKKIANTSSEKYSLRPRESIRPRRARKRFDDEVSDEGKNEKNKARSPPLSKYRRKTANARERSRMREINLAFETLRKVVPSHTPQLAYHGQGANEKLTKITTLRLAMRYIAGLTEMLRKEERNSDKINCIESRVNYCPTIFLAGQREETCTLTTLNATLADDCYSQSILSFNDSGSDGESFHSEATVMSKNFAEDSIQDFLPLEFSVQDLLSTTELS